MNESIKLVRNYQKSGLEKDYVIIQLEFSTLMKSYQKGIPTHYKEDVFQCLAMGLYNVISKFKINFEPIIPKELFINKNLKLLQSKEYQNANTVLGHTYVKNFIDKWGTEVLCEAFKSVDKRNFFLEEYSLFCNENQLIHCINKRFQSIIYDFYRSHGDYFEQEIRILNSCNENGEELINGIAGQNTECHDNILEEFDMDEKEIAFLNLFITEGKILTEAEVGKKIGISQQAVHKRKKKLKEKYFLNKNEEINSKINGHGCLK